MLVAADGANSRVRQQYLPDAHRVDTGIVAIAGKLPLTEATRTWLPGRLSGSVNNIMPPRDSFLFTAVWEGDQQRLAINDPDMPPGLLFDNTQDYVFWAYAAKRSNYPADPTGDGAQLRDMVASMISSWPQRCNGWSASPTPPPSRKWSSGQWHPSRRGLPRASPCSATPSTT